MEIRESSKSQKEVDARRLLKKRMKEIHGSRFVGPQEEKLTVDDLLDSLITHLETKGAKTVDRLKSHLKPLREWFALTRAVSRSVLLLERAGSPTSFNQIPKKPHLWGRSKR